jgi:hypothetical protein
MGDRSGAYSVLMGKPEGKRLLGRPRRRCEINIKMDLQEGGWVGNGLDFTPWSKHVSAYETTVHILQVTPGATLMQAVGIFIGC